MNQLNRRDFLKALQPLAVLASFGLTRIFGGDFKDREGPIQCWP